MTAGAMAVMYWAPTCMQLLGCVIQTYIGPVLVSVNPYRTIRHLYDSDVIDKYRNVSFYELPPHMYVMRLAIVR